MIKRTLLVFGWFTWILAYPLGLIWAPIYYILTGKDPLQAWWNWAEYMGAQS